MRSALLFGRDHHTTGALAAVAEGPAAITLSRGGFAKQYGHTELNEDAVLFAHDAGGTFVAVADGHHGASGAQAVIDYLEAEWAPRWTAPGRVVPDEASWLGEASRALGGANHALLADAAQRSLPPAPTTLALGVVRPDEGRVAWSGIGDSHVFGVTGEGATDWLAAALEGRRTAFLGYESLTDESLAVRSASGLADLGTLRALVLATDGLSETGIGVAEPAATVAAAARRCVAVDPELRPLELARQVAQAALDAHREHQSGDNVASAVVWTGR